MAYDVMVLFRDALLELGQDNAVRAVVVTGAGAGLSGADQESAGCRPASPGSPVRLHALRAMEALEEVVLTIRRLHQPVVAAVNGAAIGGGFCLALACDLRVAAPAAYFRAAGINNGLTASEPRAVVPAAPGRRFSTRAADIMLTGRDVTAEEAERIGWCRPCTTTWSPPPSRSGSGSPGSPSPAPS